MSDPTDSVINAAERTGKMITEAQRLADLAKDAEKRRLERMKLEEAETHVSEREWLNRVGAASGKEAREYLEERYRAIRADKPEPPKPMSMNERQRAQLAEEQEAGRKAAAYHKNELEMHQAARLAAQAAEAATQAMLVPVTHPNPGQDQQFPASKATLKAPGKK